jgi:predicted nucleic acid-binding protein
MEKLTVYKSTLEDVLVAEEVIAELNETVTSINCISVSSSLTINSTSSDKQYMFAIGIINSQIFASLELGIDTDELNTMKNNVLKLRTVSKELSDWRNYLDELRSYSKQVHALLNEDELFQLLRYPQKPH